MEHEKKVITNIKIRVNLSAVKYAGSDRTKVKLSNPAKYLPNPNGSWIVKASVIVCAIGRYKKIKIIIS